jgi:UDP-2,4-diacetamido-2,4,6-trideoxy-beta-L-altropyranose hydrolase
MPGHSRHDAAELPPLLLRADATPDIGVGHVMRCLALGQAWRDQGGRATLITHCTSDAVRRQARAAGLGLVPLAKPYPHGDDLPTTLLSIEDSWAGGRQSTSGATTPWLFADGYHFDTEYLAALRRSRCRLGLIVDDGHVPLPDIDVLLNQNLGAERLAYRTAPGTVRLLGTQYTLLRPEIAALRPLARESPPAADRDEDVHLLVSMGGSDPANVTPLAIAAIGRLRSAMLSAKVVVGPTNPRPRALRRLVAESASRIELVTDPARMPELLAWADMALTAAGGTCWELACLGVPNCVISVSPLQATVADTLHRAGVIRHLGPAAALDAPQVAAALKELLDNAAIRRRMGELGRQMIDGAGAARVASAVVELTQWEHYRAVA